MTAFVANAIAIRPKPAGTPNRYGTPDDLQGFEVEYTIPTVASAESTSTAAIRIVGIGYQTFQLELQYVIYCGCVPWNSSTDDLRQPLQSS